MLAAGPINLQLPHEHHPLDQAAADPYPAPSGEPKISTLALVANRTATAPRKRAPSKGDLKEAAILDAAWLLLAKRPLATITVAELAAGAGLSRPAFYFYFDSIEAVVRALALRTANDLRVALGPADTTLSARDNIRRRIGGLLARWKADGARMRAIAALAEHDANLRRFWSEVNDEINGALAAEIEVLRAGGRALPSPPTASSLVAALSAMVWRSGYEMSLLPARQRDYEELAETLTEVAVRAIFGEVSGPDPTVS